MIDRKRELTFLVEKFHEEFAQLIILWGRRRVGRTYLLKEFCSQYPAIYFLATKSSKKDQLFQLSEAIAEFFNDSLLMIKPFSEWQEKISLEFDYYVSRHCEKIIVDVLEKLTGTLPFDYERLGRYWDRNAALLKPFKRRQAKTSFSLI